MVNRRFSQVDVFTDRLGYGNPVAVVHDAEGLDDHELAQFANWTNLSETTFLLPPTDGQSDYRVRIFTTVRELPFAGHPTLGSARSWLSAGGVPRTPGLVIQECDAGLIPVRQSENRLAFAAPPLRRSGPVDADDLAEIVGVLGVRRGQVVDAAWGDNGPGWVMILLDSAATVLSVRPHVTRANRFPDIGIAGACPSGSEAAIEVRAFADGITEDPVTGSLNAALGQWLIASGRLPDSYIARQGTVLGRRGRVHVQRDGTDVWVGGDTVVGITGTVTL